MCNYQIHCVTRDPNHSWNTIGETRGEAERFYQAVLNSGRFERPIYRIIAKRK